MFDAVNLSRGAGGQITMKTPVYYVADAPITYYQIIAFPAAGMGHRIGDAYKTITSATKAARRALLQDPSIVEITLREETVYRRTEKAEFSCSGPIKSIRRGEA